MTAEICAMSLTRWDDCMANDWRMAKGVSVEMYLLTFHTLHGYLHVLFAKTKLLLTSFRIVTASRRAKARQADSP